MIIEKILKQLTPERIKKEIEAIQKIKLPPELQKWVAEYEKVGERNGFLWKWLYEAGQSTTLSSVPRLYFNKVYKIKFLIFILDVLLDDITDKRVGSENLLNSSLRIPLAFKKTQIFENLKSEEKRYCNLILRIWNLIITSAKKAPRYQEFKEIFLFDLSQLFNALAFSNIIKKQLFIANELEFFMYFSHHMTTIVCFTADLMYSPKFNIKELGLLRKIAWDSQKTARIGNWISTWEREIRENDFSNWMSVYAINSSIITAGFIKNNEKIIQKIKKAKIEKILFNEWDGYYFKIYKYRKLFKTINITKLLLGIKNFLTLNLIAKGKI